MIPCVGERMAIDTEESQLRQFIKTEHELIKRHLRMYVLNWGIAHGDAVDDEVDKLLSDLVYEALRSHHRYDASRPPLAWLLGISVNLIRRRIANRANHREITVSDLCSENMSPDEIFERYLVGTQDCNLEHLENNESWDARLAPFSETDRAIMNGKYRDALTTTEIAAQHNMKPATVRKRISRIMHQLRQEEGVDS